MEFLNVDIEDRVLIVSLARGKANALNSVMVEELLEVIGDAGTRTDISSIVLASARSNFFSAGFDATEVFNYDRETMSRFFGRFIDLYEGMLRHPKPVIGAISGHAFAGGAVLALACDERVLAEGDFGFALNGINLGMAVPPGFFRRAARAMGYQNTWTMFFHAKPFSPSEALGAGLASEVVSAAEVRARACARARKLGEKPPQTFARFKRVFMESL